MNKTVLFLLGTLLTFAYMLMARDHTQFLVQYVPYFVLGTFLFLALATCNFNMRLQLAGWLVFTIVYASSLTVAWFSGQGQLYPDSDLYYILMVIWVGVILIAGRKKPLATSEWQITFASILQFAFFALITFAIQYWQSG